MIVFRKKSVRIAEAWFGEEPAADGVDVVRCFQRAEPSAGALCREFYTILIDLTQGPDALLSAIKKGTRYEIRRAVAKDNFVYACRDAGSLEALARFCDLYDEFASRKRLPRLDRGWLSLMAATGRLYVSSVSEATGDPLVWHVYYRSGSRVTLLYSASLPPDRDGACRSRLGRANRFHHWQDMLRFKSEGAAVYDLGGWYQGAEDAGRLRINKFKEAFGGRVVKNYICERPLTTRGRLFLRLRQLLLGDAL